MENLNTYVKFGPNVYVAKCIKEHEQGETITLTTRRGKENKCIIHNYLGKSKDGLFLYSFTREDGFNSQERAKRKADKLKSYAANAEKRSDDYWKAGERDREFLSLGEPIKIGHHSERRHRKLIERNWARIGKRIAESEKAKDYERRSEYWEERANDINLSMPESLSFYEFKLEQAKKHHLDLKKNPQKRTHSYSLTYANKEVKELTKKVELAIKLWGDDEDIQQLNKEKLEEAQKKNKKGSKTDNLIKQYGGFFAFNKEQFLDGYQKLKDAGHVEEGEKVTHLRHGLYVPVKNKESFIKNL